MLIDMSHGQFYVSMANHILIADHCLREPWTHECLPWTREYLPWTLGNINKEYES